MMFIRMRMIAATSLGFSVLAWSSIAEAAPIQFRMAGTIEVLYQVGPLPDGIGQGAAFAASLSFDSATPDDRPDDPRRGYYLSTGLLRIQAGPSTIRSTGPLSFVVGNDIDDALELFEAPDDSFILRDNQFIGNFEHLSCNHGGKKWVRHRNGRH